MKKACVVLIQDVKKAPSHVEALPHLFDTKESVMKYADARLNERVTVVVNIIEIEVDDAVTLVSWS